MTQLLISLTLIPSFVALGMFVFALVWLSLERPEEETPCSE
ncbi:hypothetical protein AB0F77_39685 [Streptomyces sp. NPDC026672]